jgi:hypothetical protein
MHSGNSVREIYGQLNKGENLNGNVAAEKASYRNESAYRIR